VNKLNYDALHLKQREVKMKFISSSLVTVGTILILFGLITFLKGSAFLGVGYAVNYFHAATSFLLLALCSKYICGCEKKK